MMYHTNAAVTSFIFSNMETHQGFSTWGFGENAIVPIRIDSSFGSRC